MLRVVAKQSPLVTRRPWRDNRTMRTRALLVVWIVVLSGCALNHRPMGDAGPDILDRIAVDGGSDGRDGNGDHVCTPIDCSGRECGSNGCGGFCGAGLVCNAASGASCDANGRCACPTGRVMCMGTCQPIDNMHCGPTCATCGAGQNCTGG